MARKPDLTQLRKIAKVRELQRDAAEAEAARASAMAAERAEELRKIALRRESSMSHWHGLHENGAMPLELITLWSGDVRRESGHLAEAEGRLEAATAAKEECLGVFRTQEQHRKVAKDMVDAAAQEQARLRDEAAIQTAADRHLHGKAGS